MQAKVIILGSGGSMGVPVIGCPCPVCHSKEPLNKRFRPSIVLQVEGKNILFDCGPDFHSQAIAQEIKDIDAFLLTHTHFDHIAGLDDLRIFSLRKQAAIPCYLSQKSYDDLRKRYYYLFEKDDESVVRLNYNVLNKPAGLFKVLGVDCHYFTYYQGSMEVAGYRIGNFAYVTDIKRYEEELFDHLIGVEYLILSMQRKDASHAHLSLEDVIAIRERVHPQHCYITHMGHDIDYHDLKESLPAGILPAFDGLSFWINLD